jgi:hypothetical protein
MPPPPLLEAATVSQPGRPAIILPISPLQDCGSKSGLRSQDYGRYGKPANKRFKVDVIDTWNMTITPHDKIYESDAEIPLRGKPYLAIRILGVE